MGLPLADFRGLPQPGRRLTRLAPQLALLALDRRAGPIDCFQEKGKRRGAEHLQPGRLHAQ